MVRSRSATEASMRGRRTAAAMVTPSLGTARPFARADNREHKPACQSDPRAAQIRERLALTDGADVAGRR
jgi:hypothetical protein